MRKSGSGGCSSAAGCRTCTTAAGTRSRARQPAASTHDEPVYDVTGMAPFALIVSDIPRGKRGVRVEGLPSPHPDVQAYDPGALITVMPQARSFPFLRLQLAISGNSNWEQILGKRNPQATVNAIGAVGFASQVPF
jgi:hypothetical protein